MDIYNKLQPELQLIVDEYISSLDKYEHKIKLRVSFYAIDHLKEYFESYSLECVEFLNIKKKLPALYKTENYTYSFAFTRVKLVQLSGFKQEYIIKLL